MRLFMKCVKSKHLPFRCQHAFFACRMTEIPGLNTLCLYDVSRLSFFVRRLSSVIRRLNIRSSSFRDYFLLKNN